jgi:hypothetical protein
VSNPSSRQQTRAKTRHGFANQSPDRPTWSIRATGATRHAPRFYGGQVEPASGETKVQAPCTQAGHLKTAAQGQATVQANRLPNSLSFALLMATDSQQQPLVVISQSESTLHA